MLSINIEKIKSLRIEGYLNRDIIKYRIDRLDDNNFKITRWNNDKFNGSTEYTTIGLECLIIEYFNRMYDSEIYIELRKGCRLK